MFPLTDRRESDDSAQADRRHGVGWKVEAPPLVVLGTYGKRAEGDVVRVVGRVGGGWGRGGEHFTAGLLEGLGAVEAHLRAQVTVPIDERDGEPVRRLGGGGAQT